MPISNALALSARRAPSGRGIDEALGTTDMSLLPELPPDGRKLKLELQQALWHMLKEYLPDFKSESRYLVSYYRNKAIIRLSGMVQPLSCYGLRTDMPVEPRSEN
jgi:hypothetical protein